MKINITKPTVVIHLLSNDDNSIVATIIGNNGNIQHFGHGRCSLLATTPFISSGNKLTQLMNVDLSRHSLADFVGAAMRALS